MLVTLETQHGSRPEGDAFWIRWAPSPYENASACLILLHRSQFAELPIHSHWLSPEPRRIPTEIAHGAPLLARVEHGRWLVQCDFCAGAQLASRGDRRFFCIDCQNAAHGGKWRRVVWPGDHADIESALLERPVPATRNWNPGETVADLHRENAEYGVKAA